MEVKWQPTYAQLPFSKGVHVALMWTAKRLARSSQQALRLLRRLLTACDGEALHDSLALDGSNSTLDVSITASVTAGYRPTSNVWGGISLLINFGYNGIRP